MMRWLILEYYGLLDIVCDNNYISLTTASAGVR